ncbi:uncharacterized protein LOC113685269 [Pocillopora damicornis]|uniref:uncharacterized protein LOC113685269 n=1 Tax=Pocillopora damicornis TaxID=46731 RepID=UPI000F558385|nr:uncharacterized protein LOC113685269 [Pocillopora damicornis]
MFDLDAMDDTECKAEFRFRKNEISRLAESLDIPETFFCHQGTTAPGIEGLCLLLRRLTYPCRYSDLIPRFGRPIPELSMIYNIVLDHIYNTHGYRISQWNNTILDPVGLERHAEAIHNKGAALDNCIGFIDGTVRPICRPGELQRVVYNGHKRVHALKFQSFTLPNGMIANMYGPVEGRKHDAGMLADSGLLNDLQRFAFSTTGQPMCLYGDPAYPLRIHLQAPFRNAVLTPAMQAFNSSMSAVRESVEWLFGDIVNYFKFMDFHKNLKIGLSSVGKMYIVSALLCNAHTCCNGNQTSEYFNLEPPTLEEYFV